MFGSRAFKTDVARRETRDSQRALFGVEMTFDENARTLQAAMV